MTFDEVYTKHFPTMARYCLSRNGGDRYLAEDAAEQAFLTLFRKWDTLPSHDELFLKCWLAGTCENTMREIHRKTQGVASLDEDWCLDLVEEEQSRKGVAYDLENEITRFAEYTEALEKDLKPKEKLLFRAVVVDEVGLREAGRRLDISENAAKLKWGRLKKKLQPRLLKMLGYTKTEKGEREYEALKR